MNNPTTDAGLIQVLLEKLEKQRLPGIITSNEKVDSGKALDETELDYLKNAIADARKVIPLIDRHPEYQHIASQVMALYKEIADKTMLIEKSSTTKRYSAKNHGVRSFRPFQLLVS